MEEFLNDFILNNKGKFGIHELQQELMNNSIIASPSKIEKYLMTKGYYINKDACGCGGGNYVKL